MPHRREHMEGLARQRRQKAAQTLIPPQFWLLRCAGAVIAICLAWSPVTAETLREALERTLRTNPTLGAQQSALRATRGSLPQARAGFLPHLNAAADLGYERELPGPAASAGSALRQTGALSHGFGASLTQSLFDGGGRRALLDRPGRRPPARPRRCAKPPRPRSLRLPQPT